MQSVKTLKDFSKFAQISNRHLQSDPSFPYKDFTRSKLPTTRKARKNTFLFHQKKPTKRQNIYITRRSRYMHIYCKYISNLTKGWGNRNFQPQRERCSKRHQKGPLSQTPTKWPTFPEKKSTRIFTSNLQVFFLQNGKKHAGNRSISLQCSTQPDSMNLKTNPQNWGLPLFDAWKE